MECELMFVCEAALDNLTRWVINKANMDQTRAAFTQAIRSGGDKFTSIVYCIALSGAETDDECDEVMPTPSIFPARDKSQHC